MGRLKRCVPERIFGTPGPQKESSKKHNVPAFIHPCHFNQTYVVYLAYKDRDVLYYSKDILCSGMVNLGPRDPRKFVRGHIVSGRLVIPPYNLASIR